MHDRQREADRQVQRELVTAARSLEPALHPLNILRGYAVLVLESAAQPHDRRHLIFGNADTSAVQIGRTVDAAIFANIDSRMAESPEEECRHSDVGRDPPRQPDQIRAETDFGNFEFAVKVGALEALFDRHGEVIDVATFEADSAVDQRANAIVIPRGNSQRQPAHRVFLCPANLTHARGSPRPSPGT